MHIYTPSSYTHAIHVYLRMRSATTERNYEWVAYDRQYRREALARKDLNWSVTDPRLYNEAFTGRARSIARCNYCLQDDHNEPQCPRNPNRPMFGWFPDPSLWPAQPAGASPPTPSRTPTGEIYHQASVALPGAATVTNAMGAEETMHGSNAQGIRLILHLGADHLMPRLGASRLHLQPM